MSTKKKSPKRMKPPDFAKPLWDRMDKASGRKPAEPKTAPPATKGKARKDDESE